MEADGVFEMFLNPIDKHNLKYTMYVGDVDLTSFGCVSEVPEKKYGSDYPIKKEDCIGHVQKRMRTAPRK